VRVVTAGVHLTLYLGSIFGLIFFGDGKCVHIGSDTDGAVSFFWIYGCHDTAFAKFLGVFNSDSIKLAPEKRKSAGKIKSDLGAAVKLAPYFYRVFVHFLPLE
jgi:hypothetical protein